MSPLKTDNPHPLAGLDNVNQVIDPSLYPLPMGISGGYDYKRKLIVADTSQNAIARGVRIHEALHSAYSPKTIKNSKVYMVNQGIEDLKVNALCPEDSRPYLEPLGETLISDRPLQTHEKIPFALRYLSCHQNLLEGAASAVLDHLPDCLQPADDDEARLLDDLLNLYLDANHRTQIYGLKHPRTRRLWNQLAQSFEALLPPPPPAPPGTKPTKTAANDPKTYNVNLRLHALPLSETSPAQRKASLKKTTDMGLSLDRMDRYLTDGQVFSYRKKVLGGTILLDASGSMAVRHEEINTLLNAAPAARIAYYQGTKSKPRTEGDLYIAADKLKRCKQTDLVGIGGNNLVDLEAIQWLIDQPEPRYMITDEAWTYKDDQLINPGGARYTAIYATLKRGHVKLFRDIEACLDFLACKQPTK